MGFYRVQWRLASGDSRKPCRHARSSHSLTKGGMRILLPDVSEPGFVSAASASADSIAALQLKIYSSHFFEALIMLKGFATAAICVAILVTIDYEFWGHVQRPGAPDAKANGLLVRSLK